MCSSDLGVGAKLSREALYESVLAPSAAISHSYETHTAIVDDGRSVTGLLVSQSPREVVIRPADGVDVTIPAANLEQLVKQPVSLMPADLATLLSADLTSANLTKAIVSGAFADSANLTNANLYGASFANTSLRSATLIDATLTGTNLTGVTWGSTTCPNATVTSTGC